MGKIPDDLNMLLRKYYQLKRENGELHYQLMVTRSELADLKEKVEALTKIASTQTVGRRGGEEQVLSDNDLNIGRFRK